MPPPTTSRSRSTSARSARLARRPSAEKGLTSGIASAILPAAPAGGPGSKERGLTSGSRKRASGVVREASRKGGDVSTVVLRCEAFVRGRPEPLGPESLAGIEKGAGGNRPPSGDGVGGLEGGLAGQGLSPGGGTVLGRGRPAERDLLDEEGQRQP